MAKERFTMVDLIDYEVQLTRDSFLELEDLRARDRDLKKKLLTSDKVETLLNWTRSLSASIDHPGEKARRAFDISAFFAIVLGLMMGSGLIQGLLHYDGSQPVNVIAIIGIYAFLQILFLLNYLFKATVYRIFKKLPGGALLNLLREVSERWMQKRTRGFAKETNREAFIKAFTQRLKQLHRRILQNHAWKLFQDFGIACHAASLATFIAMLFFNDYTFGWRTTFKLEPSLLHQITSTLAWPFAWLGDFVVPSLELIERSQFSRFQNDFVMRESLDFGARSTAAWWPFLAMLILCYGLIPRIVLWLLLQRAISYDLKTLPFDDYKSDALWMRLSEERSAWSSDGPLEAARAPVVQALTQFQGNAVRNAVLVRWRDLPVRKDLISDLLKRLQNLEVHKTLDSKGISSDAEAIEEALRSLDNPVLVIAADPWELPGEAIDRIRKALREKISKNILILFAAVEEKDDEAHINFASNKTAWQHALKAYRDPYLGLIESRADQ